VHIKNIISMKKIILAALLPLAFPAGGQSDPIREIREHYYAVGVKIEACRQADAAGCDLYLDEYGLNRGQKSWRAVGVFGGTWSFWYEDDPVFFADLPEGSAAVLQKIEVIETTSALGYRKEFLYRSGQLRFVFWQERAGEQVLQEQRYYLDAQGKLLRFMDGSRVKRLSEPDQLELLKAESKRLQRQFLSAHGLN
jgi:hypothetical protein